MRLIQWEGWRELKKLNKEVNRFFDRVNTVLGPEDTYAEREPLVDIYQTAGEVVVLAEIPGIESRDDLEITVNEDTISVRGQIRRIREVKDVEYYRSERYYGAFGRNLPLPFKVDAVKARANYSNGVLEVRIPKTYKEKGHSIKLDGV